MLIIVSFFKNCMSYKNGRRDTKLDLRTDLYPNCSFLNYQYNTVLNNQNKSCSVLFKQSPFPDYNRNSITIQPVNTYLYSVLKLQY